MESIERRFGRRIRELWERAGWPQERLAEACGLHRTYIGGIECGERNVSLVNIERIAKALGLPIVDLSADAGASVKRRARG